MASAASSTAAVLGRTCRLSATASPSRSPSLVVPPFPPLHRPYTSLVPEFADLMSPRNGRAGMFFTRTPAKFRSSSLNVHNMSSVHPMTSEINGKQLPLYSNISLEGDFNDKIRPQFSFPKTFFMATASMLILPFKTLAETCEPDNSIYNMNMPLLFAIALIGATVGGLVARQRKAELAKLNDQLRQINAALRRQAKIESYAPNLSYAPVGRVAETEVIVDPRKEQLITNLRMGKNYLRNQDLEKAFAEFRTAFELAQSLGDHIEEKKAARGLGASLHRQGKYREAIKYHSKVLEIAKQSGEDSGSTEAYGAIADCYTELGDLEKAGKFYDKYIARLETD